MFTADQLYAVQWADVATRVAHDYDGRKAIETWLSGGGAVLRANVSSSPVGFARRAIHSAVLGNAKEAEWWARRTEGEVWMLRQGATKGEHGF